MADCNQDFCANSSSEDIGTSSADALACNAQFIDKVANSQDATAVNRVGETRRTLKGLEADYLQTPVNGGVWAPGIEFTAYNQYMVYNGVPYKPKFATPLPYTTVNADATLDAGVEPFEIGLTGAGLQSYTGYVFSTVANMKLGLTVGGESVDPAIGARLSTQGYYTAGDGGGGAKVKTSELFGEIGGYNTEDDIRRMSYAAAREDAVETVKMLLENNGLKLVTADSKAGFATRFDVITSAIDKLTVEYFFDAATGRKLDTVADAGTVDVEGDGELPDSDEPEFEEGFDDGFEEGDDDGVEFE